MSDRLENFESELAAMRPRNAAQWSQRLAMEMRKQRRSDRMLIGAISLGAMAACVIVSLLIVQSPAPVQSAPIIAVNPQSSRMGNDLNAFADAGVLDAWK